MSFAGLLALSVTLWLAIGAGAVVSESGFEDDDGNLAPNGGTPNFDWNSFAPTTWTGTAPYRESDKIVSGWTFKGIEDDQNSTADTAFAGGTKQDNDCPTVIAAKAPNKDDLKRIYLSTKVIGGHTYLNLAWVRIPQNTTSSSAHVAFEFNKGDTPCGPPSDGLVERSAGDMLIVYDFEGGSAAPTIKLARWVTTGTLCDVASHSPPCWGPATNLTALPGGVAEAAVNVGQNVTDQIAPSPPETLRDSEFGEAGIDLTDAGVFSSGTCESFGNAFGVSRSSGNSGTAQMKDLVGPADFRLANCGTVIIRKVTDPAGDTTTSFGYTTNVTTNPSTTTSPFSLMDGESNTIANVNAGGGLNVTEDDPSPGYKLTSIDCSASTVPAANYSTDTTTRAVTFSIAGGETLDCTFTNTKQEGALRILKKSTKTGQLVTNAGAVFSYDGSTVTDNGSGDEDSDVGEVCVSGLATGDYTVNETSPPNGYGDATESGQTATVVAGTNCSDNQPSGSGVVAFTNPPLSDIQVRFRDGGSGETALSEPITCDNATGAADDSDTTGWDDTHTVTGIEAGATTVTVQCTVKIDP